MKKVLVLGSGAREHAIAWKLSLSPDVSEVVVCPGNDGMDETPGLKRWLDCKIQPPGFDQLISRTKAERIDFCVVGPDQFLSDGVVDAFRSAGVWCFGPTKAAARIESSKSFSKSIMQKAEIPTAKFFVAESRNEAERIIAEKFSSGTFVIKADGLALGKGVEICQKKEDAATALDRLQKFSNRFVIEEFLTGEEVSWFALCSMDNDQPVCAVFESARDYKRVGDGDSGPNTGGMGAFSPVPGHSREKWEKILKEKVFLPILRELQKEGSPFTGLLYAGLMVERVAGKPGDRFWVLEFNARFGDPEAEAVLPRLKGDLLPWLLAATPGSGVKMSDMPASIPFDQDYAVYIVAAAEGYPDQPKLGDSLQVTLKAPDVFFAGVRREGKQLMTSGGRVFGSLGLGSTLQEARENSERKLAQIGFRGMHHRRDIGA